MIFCDLEPLFYIKLELEREKKPFDWYNRKLYRNKNHLFYKAFTERADVHRGYDRISSHGTLEEKRKNKHQNFLRGNFSELSNYGLGPDFANNSPYLTSAR